MPRIAGRAGAGPPLGDAQAYLVIAPGIRGSKRGQPGTRYGFIRYSTVQIEHT
jgi:hypothetical protein